MSIDVQPQQTLINHTPGSPSRMKFTVRAVDLPSLDVVARVHVSGPTPAEWASSDAISVDRPGRTIPAGGTDEFIVTIALPLGTPAGQYPFELRLASQASGVEVFGKSPSVAVAVAATEAPKPARWRLWLIIASAVLLALGIGFAVYRLTADPWTMTPVVENVRVVAAAPVAVPRGEELTLILEHNLIAALGYSDGVVLGPAGADGAGCERALAGGIRSRAPIPVDGRVLCLDLGAGDGRVGVVRLHGISGSDVTLSVELWER